MCHENTQVEFEFGSGGIIFSTVMPLGLTKIPIMGHKNTQIKFRYGSIFSIILSNVMHLALMYLGYAKAILSKSHILTLQSPRGHPCCIDTFLVILIL